MQIGVCELSVTSASEICSIDFISGASLLGLILIIGFGIIYLTCYVRDSFTDLLYLHDLRATIVVALIFVDICKIGDATLSMYPPANGEFMAATPFAPLRACISLCTVLCMAAWVRAIEIRNKTEFLYLVVIVEGVQLILNLFRLVRISQDVDVLHLHSILYIISSILLFGLGLTDAFTIFKENHPTKRNKLNILANENIGYKHPYATLPSKLTFWWLGSLFWRGFWEPLELEDLGNLYEEDTSRFQYDRFLFNFQKLRNERASLWFCYIKSYWKLFAFGGVLKLLGDLTGLAGPLSISYIVDYIERTNSTKNSTAKQLLLHYTNETLTPFQIHGQPNESDLLASNNNLMIYYPNWNEFFSNGWIIGILVLCSSIAQGTLSQASTHIVNLVGIRLKTSIQGLVYRKTLLMSSSCFYANTSNNTSTIIGECGVTKSNDESSPGVGASPSDNQEARHEQTTRACEIGAIPNLMSEDAFNVMSFFWIAHYVWAIPLKIACVMYLLYRKLGVSAIIGALFCIATMTPLQFFIGKMMSRNGKLASESTDARLKKINEVLLGIKLIKLNAWENVFKERIQEARNKEIHYLNVDSIYWTLMTFLTHVSSVLITFVTMAVFINIETSSEKFTASRVFAALALFNQLTVPLFIFPITVPIVIAAVVSTSRLEHFLDQPEVEKEFEGVVNMARVLCRSDASLDIYEEDERDDKNQSCCASDQTESRESSTFMSLSPSLLDSSSLLSSPNQKQLSDTIPMIVGSAETAAEVRAGVISLTQGRQVTKKRNQLSRTTLQRTNRSSSGSSVSREMKLTICDSLILSIRNGEFVWQKQFGGNATDPKQHQQQQQQQQPQRLLKVAKLDIQRGKLTIIVGKSGSGKSSLLAVLLKEMHNLSGDVIWNKYSTIAYVSQNPWLLNTTIRENILFGESFRPKRYEKILQACALKPDIELMPAGDMSEIGERGINLSGGQRQRIAIARALYSSANVVVMDDPFSSLDYEVEKHILENGIKRMLCRQKRTTVLVTQNLQLLKSADFIVAMEKNGVRASGTYQEIESADPALTQAWDKIVKERSLASLGKTARERWKLFKNVSRIGMQRVAVSEENDLQSLTQSSYKTLKRRQNMYGSRHLTYDMPFPIDECLNEDIEIRHRPSKRHFIDQKSFDDMQNGIFRTNSLQTTVRRAERIPVVRNISSPTTLQQPSTSRPIESFNSNQRNGFKNFLRRMSSRRTSPISMNDSVGMQRDKMRPHRTVSTSNSIKSIDEEDVLEHMPVKRLISSVSKCSEETEDDICSDINEELSNRLMYAEERKYGTIPTRIYMLYLRACGFGIVSIFCLSAFGWQALRVCTDVWLQDWTDLTANNMEQAEIFQYFTIYGLLTLTCIILSVISTPAGQLAGCQARKRLHNDLIEAILGCTLHFFHTNPIGRILNRFTNDINIIDKKIAPTCQRLLQFILLCLCAVLINTIITPWFVLLTIPICSVYYVVQKFYRTSSRELQRIESITSSPVISHFGETIQGVTTIRAYNQEARFMEILFRRIEANNVAFIILNTSNRWLGIALDYLGGVIVFCAIITALFTAHIYPETTVPSLVGLAINYTLLVPIYLNWVVKLLSDMEMYIGAVERVDYYIQNGQRKRAGNYRSVAISWPQKGDISFENVSLRYEDQKQNVITALNLSIPGGQRIGICGRTGSGKSSLALSLFGVLEVTAGRILIDDIDISTIHLDELRSRLSIIPQEGVLFGGTIRDNLDPRGHYTDLELWNCLETAQLKESILEMPHALDTEFVEGGSNLSAGQRQLFCLARAVLRGSSCLVLDEATSSLDTATESELLQAAAKAFQGRTVITIAHRLATLLDHDRIIVLEHGKIVEDGAPTELKNKIGGKFASILKSAINQPI